MAVQVAGHRPLRARGNREAILFGARLLERIHAEHEAGDENEDAGRDGGKRTILAQVRLRYWTGGIAGALTATPVWQATPVPPRPQ